MVISQQIKYYFLILQVKILKVFKEVHSPLDLNQLEKSQFKIVTLITVKPIY